MYIMFYMRLKVSFPRKLKVEKSITQLVEIKYEKAFKFSTMYLHFHEIFMDKEGTLTSLINGHTRLFFSEKKSSLPLGSIHI